MAFSSTLISKNYQNITGSVGSRLYNGGNFGFDPRIMPKSMLYLDASYLSNVITDSQNNVTSWKDLSVKSLQSSPRYSVTADSNYPTYSNKAINFSGNQYMIGSASAVCELATDDFAIFVVAKVPSTTTSQYILSKYSSANLHWELYFDSSNNVVFSYTYGSGLSKTVTSVTVTSGETIVISVICPRKIPLGTNIYINGVGSLVPVTGVATTISTNTNLYIGVNHTTTTDTGFLTSSINEILMYRNIITSTTVTSVLNPNQQQQIEGYLAWKWGVRSKLPLGTDITISGSTVTSNTFTLSAAKSMADNAGVIFRDLPTGVTANLYYVLNATTSSKDFQLTATKSGTTALSPTFTISQLTRRAWYGTTYIKTTGYSTATGRLILAQPGLRFNQGDTFVLSKSVAGLTAGIIYYAGYQNSAQDTVLYVANSYGNIIVLSGASSFTAYLIKEPTEIIVDRWTGANSKNAFFSSSELIQGQSIVFPSSYAGLTAKYPYYVYENSNADQTFHVYDSYYAIYTLSGTQTDITARIGSSIYNNSLTSPVKSYLTKPFLSPFRPPDIPNCKLWLDGADASSIVFTSGTNKVVTWKDKSGLSHDAASDGYLAGITYQNTPTVPSTNGVRIFQNYNSNSDLKITSTAMLNVSGVLAGSSSTTQGYYKSIFVVCSPTAFYSSNLSSGAARVNVSNVIGSTVIREQSIAMSFNDTGSYSDKATTMTQIQVCQSGTINTVPLNQTTYLNNQYMISTHLDNLPTRTLTLKCNGDTVGTMNPNPVTTDTDTTVYTRIGADGATTGGDYYYRYNGYVNEVIIYQSTNTKNFGLTQSQIQQVEGYLAWKWGLPDPNKANLEITTTTILGVTTPSEVTYTTTSQPLIPIAHPFTEFPSANVVPY